MGMNTSNNSNPENTPRDISANGSDLFFGVDPYEVPLPEEEEEEVHFTQIIPGISGKRTFFDAFEEDPEDSWEPPSKRRRLSDINNHNTVVIGGKRRITDTDFDDSSFTSPPPPKKRRVDNKPLVRINKKRRLSGSNPQPLKKRKIEISRVIQMRTPKNVREYKKSREMVNQRIEEMGDIDELGDKVVKKDIDDMPSDLQPIVKGYLSDLYWIKTWDETERDVCKIINAIDPHEDPQYITGTFGFRTITIFGDEEYPVLSRMRVYRDEYDTPCCDKLNDNFGSLNQIEKIIINDISYVQNLDMYFDRRNSIYYPSANLGNPFPVNIPSHLNPFNHPPAMVYHRPWINYHGIRPRDPPASPPSSLPPSTAQETLYRPWQG